MFCGGILDNKADANPCREQKTDSDRIKSGEKLKLIKKFHAGRSSAMDDMLP